MRWGRGFFRLWIAATIIWTTVVVAFVGKEPFEGLWRGQQWKVAHDLSGVTVVVDRSQSPELLKAQMIDAVKRAAMALEQKGDSVGAKEQLEWAAGTEIDDFINDVSTRSAKRSEQLYSTLTWLLGPPVGLLAFGFMTAWVARGFRR